MLQQQFVMRGNGKLTDYNMALNNRKGFKSIFFVLLLCCFSIQGVAWAQPHNKDSALISRHRPGMFWYLTGWRPAKSGKLRKYDRLIVDLNYNILADPKLIKTRPFASIGWGIHTMSDIPLTRGNTVSLGIGLTYKHQKVGMQGMFQSDSTGQYTLFYRDSIAPNTSKYRFGNHQVVLPLELRFRQNKWNHIKFHIGGSIGYRFRTYQKWIDPNGEKRRDVSLNDVNPWVYGVHMRFGIRNIALFGEYTISPAFKNSKSTKIQGVTFGLSFSIF